MPPSHRVLQRQGKKEEARATLNARLEANPHTRAAYERLIALEEEAGEHEDLDTFVRGKKVGYDVRPLIEENRTLVPIRALVDALGAEIAWNAETQVVTISKDGKTIELTIGSNIAKVDGVEVELDAPAKIVEGNRTVVPIRFVSQGLGLYVKWLAEQRTILVTEEPVADE
ncbi:MAG: stalk domain-containing protein [Bacillota bacterium]